MPPSAAPAHRLTRPPEATKRSSTPRDTGRLQPPSNQPVVLSRTMQLALANDDADTTAKQLATSNQPTRQPLSVARDENKSRRPPATQPTGQLVPVPIPLKIDLVIQRSSSFIAPFLDDANHIMSLENTKLILLRETAQAFYDDLDSSFDTAFYVYMAMQYCAAVSALDPGHQSHQKLAQVIEWLDHKLRGTHRCFRKLADSVPMLLKDLKSAHGPQENKVLGRDVHPLVQLAELVKSDVLYRYGDKAPEIFAKLDESIRGLNTFLDDINRLREWWGDLRVASRNVMEETSPFSFSEQVNQRSTATRALAFSYLSEMEHTVSSSAGRTGVLEYPNASKIIRTVLDNTRRLTAVTTVDRPVPSFEQEKRAIHWLRVQSYVLLNKTIPINVAGHEYKHSIDARVMNVERYKNEDFGLKLVIQSRRMTEKLPDSTPGSDKKDESKETLTTGYRCSRLTLTWSFDQRLPGGNPVIVDFQPASSITNVTEEKFSKKKMDKLNPAVYGARLVEFSTETGHEYALPFATLGEGFRTDDGTGCEWNVIVNPSRVLSTDVSVSDCCFGVVIGLGDLDPSAFTRMKLDVTVHIHAHWARGREGKLVKKKLKSGVHYETFEFSGKTSLPLRLLSKLQLVPTVESSKPLLDACALLPPREL